MTLEESIKPYINAVEKGVEQENWILAMMGALTIPDICTNMTGINKDVKDDISKYITKDGTKEYIRWFKKYCPHYEVTFTRKKNREVFNDMKTTIKSINVDFKNPFNQHEFEEVSHTYFNGILAYALRCSLLHSGDGMVSNQWIHKNNKDFTLETNEIVLDFSNENRVIDYDDSTKKIHLNPKHFCEEVIDGIYMWIEDYKMDTDVVSKASRLIDIRY